MCIVTGSGCLVVFSGMLHMNMSDMKGNKKKSAMLLGYFHVQKSLEIRLLDFHLKLSISFFLFLSFSSRKNHLRFTFINVQQEFYIIAYFKQKTTPRVSFPTWSFESSRAAAITLLD